MSEEITDFEAEQIKDLLQQEFGVPVEVNIRDTPSDVFLTLKRLAKEYGSGNSRKIMNRAIRGEMLGGEILISMLGELSRKLKSAPPKGESTSAFYNAVLVRLSDIRQKMSEDIIRKYAHPAGLDEVKSLLAFAEEADVPQGAKTYLQDLISDISLILDDMGENL